MINLCIAFEGDLHSESNGIEIYIKTLIDSIQNNKNSIDIKLFVINMAFKANSYRYNDIVVYNSNNIEEIVVLLKKEKTQILHLNHYNKQLAFRSKQIGINVITTLHTCFLLCPTYDYLNYHNQLCTKSLSINNCLKCYLSKIKYGYLSYPLLKLLPEKWYISLGKKLDGVSFIKYITPVLQAAYKLNKKKQDINHLCIYSDLIIVQSSRMREQAMKNSIHEQKIILIPNGVPKKYTHTPELHKNEVIKFYFVGRTSIQKGIHILLNAFCDFESSKTELHIFGEWDTKYTSQLKEKYNHNNIFWHGKVQHNQLDDYIKDYQVLVFPSIGHESCPITIAEALAAGKYVIATQCGGPEDQIIEGVNGTLIEPNNIQALKTAMQAYIDNPVIPQVIKYVSMDEHLINLKNTYETLINNQAKTY